MPMTFLRPISRQFPFDEVASQIVAALELRHWKVPGISVDIRDYGSGEQKLRAVQRIKSAPVAGGVDLDFEIYFCRIQGLLPEGRFNDTAAVSEILIPKKLIHVYEDESGPTFELYVGADWEADRERFRWGSINERLDQKPRKALKYHGDRTGGYHGERTSRLIPVGRSDFREYAPNEDGAMHEPVCFKTSDVMNGMRDYLRDVVLPAIEACPVPENDSSFNLLATPAEMPMPAGVGPLFAFCEYQDFNRIELAMKSIREPGTPPSELERWNEYKAPLADRYGLAPDLRLCSLDVKSDGTVPEAAYGGFVWCGIGDVTPTMREDELDVPGGRKPYQSLFVVRVTPRCANGVYIADHGAYDKRRAELAKLIKADPSRQGPSKSCYNGAEANDFMCARARTLIPIAEYKGGYANPVALINRELGLDEIEVVGGDRIKPRRERDEAKMLDRRKWSGIHGNE